MQAQNPYFDYLIDQSFKGINIFFLLLFENNEHRTSHKRYFLPTLEIKNYTVMTDGRNFVDQPFKNDIKTYENVRKITTDYAAGC